MPRSRTTQICSKQVRRIIESAMAEQGTSFRDLARRLGHHESSARQFIRDVGTKKHHRRVATQLSLALNKPGNRLLGILQDNNLR